MVLSHVTGPSESFIASAIPFVILVVVFVVWRAAIRGQQRRRAARRPRAAVPPATKAPAAVASRPRSAPPLTAREPEATLPASRFVPLEELGRGGMGVVWRARDRVLGRQVAIKQLLPPAGLSAGARETMRARMLREARAAAQLDHGNAVTVHDVLVDQDSVLIVMELVKAVTLAQAVERLEPRSSTLSKGCPRSADRPRRTC